MFDYRAKALAMASVGALAGVAGCDDPVQGTDLRKAGSPSVIAVTVQTDPAASNVNYESATYCKLNDVKRPGLVGGLLVAGRLVTSQVCPEDLSMPAETDGVAPASPSQWFVRVVFDRLLDPNVEDLIDQLNTMGMPTGVKLGSFLMTQPVSLKCGGVDVPYDGYYVPNGNSQSWPLGPSLFIKPVKTDGVPTGTKCEIALKANVTGKAGEKVEATDPAKFLFDVAALKLLSISPSAGTKAKEQDSTSEVAFTFNANLKAGTGAVDPADVVLVSKPNLAGDKPDESICAAGAAGTVEDPYTGVSGRVMVVGDNASPDADHALQLGRTYRLELKASATATAKAGGTATVSLTKPLCFYTLSN